MWLSDLFSEEAGLLSTWWISLVAGALECAGYIWIKLVWVCLFVCNGALVLSLAAVPLGLLPTKHFRIAMRLLIQRIIFFFIIFHVLFAFGKITLGIVVFLHKNFLRLLLLLGFLIHADIIKTLQTVIFVSKLRYILKVPTELWLGIVVCMLDLSKRRNAWKLPLFVQNLVFVAQFILLWWRKRILKILIGHK